MRPPFIKHVLELRAEDFERHPVWINAYNTDLDEPWYYEEASDEATYRPWEGPLPYDCGRRSIRPPRVAATFVLASGMVLPGCCHPPGPRTAPDNFSYTHPLVFAGDEVIGFWAGANERMVEHHRARLSRAVGARDVVFPVRYQIRPGITNLEFTGEIKGFGRLLPPDHRTAVIEP
jgi:hypothetical protein